MSTHLRRYWKVRELVKDGSLKIKDIAQQTGYDKGHVSRLRKESQRKKVIADAVAAEREACAKVCEEVESRAEELWDKFAYPEDQGMASGARQCTTAIRARGQA